MRIEFSQEEIVKLLTQKALDVLLGTNWVPTGEGKITDWEGDEPQHRVYFSVEISSPERIPE